MLLKFHPSGPVPYKLVNDYFCTEYNLLLIIILPRNQRRNLLNTMSTHSENQKSVNEREENIFLFIPNLIGMRKNLLSHED
jgi:hypothetical protein